MKVMAKWARGLEGQLGLSLRNESVTAQDLPAVFTNRLGIFSKTAVIAVAAQLRREPALAHKARQVLIHLSNLEG